MNAEFIPLHNNIRWLELRGIEQDQVSFLPVMRVDQVGRNPRSLQVMHDLSDFSQIVLLSARKLQPRSDYFFPLFECRHQSLLCSDNSTGQSTTRYRL